MIVLRVVAYAVLGAAVAAAVLAGFELYILRLAQADVASLPLASLLVEVMQLPRYAAMGAVLGALVAPFPGRGSHPLVRLVGWTLAGVVVGLLAPLARELIELQRLPTFADVRAHFAVDPPALVGSAATGFVLSWAQTALEAWQRWRRRRRRALTASPGTNDVDATLKAYWRDRAETYLAQREHRE